MKVTFKNADLQFSKGVTGVDGVTFGSYVNSQTLKNAIKAACIEILDPSYDKTVVPMALTFTNPSSGYHVAQLGLYNPEVYDGTILFSWIINHEGYLTGVHDIVLNPNTDLYRDKIKIHLKIDFSEFTGSLFFRNAALTDVSQGVSFNLPEMIIHE